MLKKIINSIKRSVRRYPMVSFFAVLMLLFTIIFTGNLIRKPDDSKEKEPAQSKKTEIFSFGEIPQISLSAKVDKKSVITVNATISGIVKYINTYEGQQVSPGTVMVSLTDTYGGANISAIDKQIAQKTKDIQNITYGKNEDILDHQRDGVPKTDNETNEMARKQITVSKRNLDLTKDTIALNLKKSEIADTLHYPSAPTYGVVERIHVRPGQQVQAGTPLVSFVGDENTGTAEILISLQIAKMISVENVSYIHINGEKIESRPIYISKESTNDQHYSVLYSIPKEYLNMVADKSFVRIDVPLENGKSADLKPMIPIDAVQLTQDRSYVFLFIDGKAQNKEVELGNVYGQFVQVIKGIDTDDEIILNRNVFHGDSVSKIEK